MNPKIFLDSGDSAQTRAIVETYPQLAGQTTNPTLIARSSMVTQSLSVGMKFTRDSLMELYKKTVNEISAIIPDGDISIEVYADQNSTVDDLVAQAMVMYEWAPCARIKLPMTRNGILAARELLAHNMRINMTLCFSLDQAVALHYATSDFDQSLVVISPFVGRLDDIGVDGISLLSEMKKVYFRLNSKIHILAASIRTIDHVVRASAYADIITLPEKVFGEWASVGFSFDQPIPLSKKLSVVIPEISVGGELSDWTKYNISHDLTTSGLEKFASDWNSLLQ